MINKKPYEQPEESLDSLVQDDSVMEYATTTQLLPFDVDPLEDIAYVQELNARIDEAEMQFARGEFLSSEEVHRGAIEFLNSRKCI